MDAGPLAIGAAVAFIVALAVALWIFYDSSRRDDPATAYKAIATATGVLSLPALILAIAPTIAPDETTGRVLIYLGLVAGVLALLTGIAYAVGRGRSAARPSSLSSTATQQIPQPMPQPMPPAPAVEASVQAPPVNQPLPLSSGAGGTQVGVPPPWAAPRNAPVNRTEIMRRAPRYFAWLVALNGPYRGQEFRLDLDDAGETELIIGRAGDQTQMVLDDPSVSRLHARIRLENGRFILHDMGSANSTFVNGQKTLRAELNDMDQIQLGEMRLVFIQAFETRPNGRV